MMEEGELSEGCQTMGTGSMFGEGNTSTSFNWANIVSKKDNSSLSRVNSKLKEGTSSLSGAKLISNQKENSSYTGVSLISKEDGMNSLLKEKSRLDPMLNKERVNSYSLKKERNSKIREGKTCSSTKNRRQEKSPFSKANLIFKKEKSYDLIEAASLFETKSSLTDAPISFFTTNLLLKEEEEEKEKDEIQPFEKSVLLLNVPSCCLDNLPGHSVRRKRADLKPASRQRAFSSRRRARRLESGDQSPDQSLQVRERPKSPLVPPSLQPAEMRMQALFSKPWSLFLCLILLLPQMAICDIPRCNPENMGDNPFCIPLDYNKVRKVG